MERYLRIKLFALIVTVGLLAFGWIVDEPKTALAGVVVYGVVCLSDLVWQVIAARYYRLGEHEKWNRPDSKVKKVVDFIQGTVTLSGLGSMFVAIHHKAAESGIAIWVIAVVTYFVSGVIAQNVAGIPLRMGYGGWKVDRRRGRRRR